MKLLEFTRVPKCRTVSRLGRTWPLTVFSVLCFVVHFHVVHSRVQGLRRESARSSRSGVGCSPCCLPKYLSELTKKQVLQYWSPTCLVPVWYTTDLRSFCGCVRRMTFSKPQSLDPNRVLNSVGDARLTPYDLFSSTLDPSTLTPVQPAIVARELWQSLFQEPKFQNPCRSLKHGAWLMHSHRVFVELTHGLSWAYLRDTLEATSPWHPKPEILNLGVNLKP